MIKLEIDITKLDIQGLLEAQAIIDAVIARRTEEEIPGPDYGDEVEDGTRALTDHLNTISGTDASVLIDSHENEEPPTVAVKPKRWRKAKVEPVPSYSVAIPEIPPVPLPDAAPIPTFPSAQILSTDLVNLMIDSEKAGKITQIELLEIVKSVGLEAVRDVCLTTPERVSKIWAAVKDKVGG